MAQAYCSYQLLIKEQAALNQRNVHSENTP